MNEENKPFLKFSKEVFIILMILAVALGFLVGAFVNGNNEKCEVPDLIIEQTNFTDKLDIVEENCGSTFITTKHDEEGYFIFADDCKSGGYCKSKYIPLRECLE